MAVVVHRRTPPLSVDRSSLTCSTVQVLPQVMCITPSSYVSAFYGEVVWAGVRLELPLCPGHVVVGQLHYALMVRAPAPRHQTEVAIYASGNFWMGT